MSDQIPDFSHTIQHEIDSMAKSLGHGDALEAARIALTVPATDYSQPRSSAIEIAFTEWKQAYHPSLPQVELETQQFNKAMTTLQHGWE